MIYIVGIGPGNKKYMIYEAIDIIKNSDYILGFKRAMSTLDFVDKEKKITVNTLAIILDFINNNKGKNISLVASGDPCFYGISNYINKNFNGEIKIIPGISSYQYMMCKLNIPWQESYLGSLHGRYEDFIEKVLQYKKSIWLTDKNNSPSNLCLRLHKDNINALVYVGENLSYQDEKITKGYPKDLKDKSFSNLSVVYIENVDGI